MKKFTHVPCGGLIDVKKRQCQKCNHKWSRTEMLFDPYSIRLIEYEDKSKVTKNTSYAKWADRFPSYSRNCQ